jgi:hypothetical protein
MDIEHDKALIERLGGPAKVAELLGYEKDGGTQRVHNWTSRGIPAKVKLERPDLFLGQQLATDRMAHGAAAGRSARGHEKRFIEGSGRGGR